METEYPSLVLAGLAVAGLAYPWTVDYMARSSPVYRSRENDNHFYFGTVGNEARFNALVLNVVALLGLGFMHDEMILPNEGLAVALGAFLIPYAVSTIAEAGLAMKGLFQHGGQEC